MSTPQQRSHILKFKRAQEHLAEFYRAEVDWFAHHCSSVFELDQQDSQYVLLKASSDAIPAEPFSLLISEILHNLRSGLDNLAFALAVAYHRPHDLPDKIAEDSQFPIIGDEDRGRSGQGPTKFKNQARRICGMHPDAQAVIKSLQPYRLGSDFRGDKLWNLMRLSNLDKHRLLHVCAVHLGGYTYPRPELRLHQSMEFTTPVSVIERDTVVARVRRSAFPEGNPNLGVDIGLSMNIGIAESPGNTIWGSLCLTYNYIATGVLPKLEPFL